MSYLTIVSQGPNNWNALVPELSCIVTARSRVDILRMARESIAVALAGEDPRVPSVTRLDQVDPAVRAELPDGYALEALEPAERNPVSAEIAAALAATGVSQSELARRLNTSRSAVSRLVNPFYWGHSLDVLRRIAAAIGADLSVHITTRAA